MHVLLCEQSDWVASPIFWRFRKCCWTANCLNYSQINSLEDKKSKQKYYK